MHLCPFSATRCEITQAEFAGISPNPAGADCDSRDFEPSTAGLAHRGKLAYYVLGKHRPLVAAYCTDAGKLREFLTLRIVNS